jgi:hypothetical protein
MNVHMHDAEHGWPLFAGRLVRSGPKGITAAPAGAAAQLSTARQAPSAMGALIARH